MKLDFHIQKIKTSENTLFYVNGFFAFKSHFISEFHTFFVSFIIFTNHYPKKKQSCVKSLQKIIQEKLPLEKQRIQKLVIICCKKLDVNRTWKRRSGL